MQGTLVCAVIEGAGNDDAVAQAVAVSERLGLRLVLAKVVDGIAPLGNGDGSRDESVTTKGDRRAAEHTLAELARDHGVEEIAERRVAVGDPVTLLGRIASEEAATLIVVGAQTRGWMRPRLQSRLAEELETVTPVPVLIAPPRARSARRATDANGAGRR